MALAGPSRLVAPMPAHTYDEDFNELSDRDSGTGKQREYLDVESDTDVGKGLIVDSETGWGLQALCDEAQELGDAFTRLTMTVGQMARETDMPPPLPTIRNSQKASSLRHRFLSAFRNKFKSQSPPLPRVCVVCQDPILDNELEVRVPCGHFYDKECIIALFQASTKDESLFPPRCCKLKIPFRKVQMHFPPWLLKEFAETSKEFSIVKRVYCDLPRCSRFLGRQVGGITWLVSGPKTYTCTCGTTTCTRCKKAHRNNTKHFCDKTDDDGMEIVLALGKVEGWARCPKCRTMIELNMGCYHMTCLCKAQFCYLCQARWKTCSCKQWDETRLVAAAEERIDRALGLADAARRPAPVLARLRHNHGIVPAVLPIQVQPDREVLIQAAVDELRVNHDCQHAMWRYRDGGGRCVGCYDVLDRYVYHCMGCHTIACNRCRLNRI